MKQINNPKKVFFIGKFKVLRTSTGYVVYLKNSKKPIYYYSQLNELLKCLLENDIRLSSWDTLQEVIAKINNYKLYIDEKFPILK